MDVTRKEKYSVHTVPEANTCREKGESVCIDEVIERLPDIRSVCPSWQTSVESAVLSHQLLEINTLEKCWSIELRRMGRLRGYC